MKHIKNFELNEKYSDDVEKQFHQKLSTMCYDFQTDNDLSAVEIQVMLDNFVYTKINKPKGNESTLLLIFRTQDLYTNKHTLAVNQRADNSLSYSFYGGWQSSGMGHALSNMMMKKSLPTSVKGFSNIKQLQSEIQSCINSGAGEKVMKVEEINKIRK